MKKSLFDDSWHERWTDAARELDSEVTKAIVPIIAKYAEQGYRLREVAYVMEQAMFLACVLPISRNHIPRKEVD